MPSRRAVEWETIYGQSGIIIQVASMEALLACQITTLERAEEFYGEFSLGDAFRLAL